ncbi:hypothetical protein Gotur_033029 [Gossypium turneri]
MLWFEPNLFLVSLLVTFQFRLKHLNLIWISGG